MNSGFYPQVLMPSIPKVQTLSYEYQTPFYFGGSFIPIDLGIKGNGVRQKTKYEKLFSHNGSIIKKPQLYNIR